MNALERIDKSAEAALRVTGAIKSEQLGHQTPCSEWNVQGLMNHMIGSMRFFAARAHGGQAPNEPAQTTSCEDAVSQLSASIRANTEAWHALGALSREGGEFMAGIAATEMVVHGWDLAKATDQPYAVDEALAQDMLTAARVNLTPERRGEAFGPEQQAPGDASTVDQLAAFMGRRL
jgi:uncharacterized protein (TIGR03086 family)